MAGPEADEGEPLLNGSNGSRYENGDAVSASNGHRHDPRHEFDPKGDVDNPYDWPAPFKWLIVSLLAAMAFTVTFTCISVVPIAHQIIEDVSGGQSPDSSSVLLVTIWELGEAAGPLLIAPLSELFGRYPVVNGANVLFIAFTVLAALSPSAPLLITARMLTGAAVTVNVLNPAIVGDMFASEERGSPMSIIMLAPLLGGATGPAISGAIAQTAGWRVVLCIGAAIAGACEILFLCCFRETYKVPILKQRALRLRQEQTTAHSTGYVSAVPAGGTDPIVTDVGAGENGEGVGKLAESIMRPAYVLAGSGVLATLSLFGAVVFSNLYILSVSLPIILLDLYGLSPAATGACFLVFSIGSLIAVAICNIGLDRIYIKLKKRNGGVGRPEYRLPLCICGALGLPFVIAVYGWVVELHLPLWVLLLTIGFMGTTLLLSIPPIMAYVVDACGLFSASAMTGLIVTRCLASTVLPLATAPVVRAFGYGWGFSLLGAVMLCLAPIPIGIMRYGHIWRQHSKYTKDQ